MSRRLGGGYGSKISRSTSTACACALVAYKLNQPARFVLSIEDNMRTAGKRHHSLFDVSAAFYYSHPALKTWRIICEIQYQRNVCTLFPPQSCISFQYEIEVDDNGEIQCMDFKQWSNSGCSFNEFACYFVFHHMNSCYNPATWSRLHTEVRTDIPSNTFTRGPGN